MALSGVFLVLDGIDGAGKSTQLALLQRWLLQTGRNVVSCRDPGGTPVGEEIRRLLLDGDTHACAACESLLYLASRAQLVHEIIRPALAAEKIVLCDRFMLSTLVYQGHAGGVDPDLLRAAGTIATGGLTPDWTGILDLPASSAADRRQGPADRIESRSSTFHQKVREGYLIEAARDPQRITVIAAQDDPQSVHEQILREVRRVLHETDRS